MQNIWKCLKLKSCESVKLVRAGCSRDFLWPWKNIIFKKLQTEDLLNNLAFSGMSRGQHLIRAYQTKVMHEKQHIFGLQSIFSVGFRFEILKSGNHEGYD